ncbi:MAG: rhodanese-like domain-containing protein [Luteolibacter sp.]
MRLGKIFPALAALACLLTACSEPPEKPVPALDPSKAVKDKSATEEVTPEPAAPAKPARLTRMPLGDLYQLVQRDAAVIYDVRPKTFYLLGHIPGAISWPEKSFDQDLAKHEPKIKAAIAGNTPVVIYCTDMACPDALNVATRLVRLGHSVSVLQGGYEAWKIAAQ